MRALAARASVLALLLATATASVADLTPELERSLASSTYVYIASERKDGGFGSPAEIWFMWDDGAVWVGTPATSWRAKRIKAGRPRARIAVGSRGGPTFTATGAIVSDPARHERLFTTFATKYPDGWTRYEARFREGMKDGTRVLIRYDPVRGAVPSASPASASPAPRPSADR